MKNKTINILINFIKNSKKFKSLHIYLNNSNLISNISFIRILSKKLNNIFDKADLLKYGFIYQKNKKELLQKPKNSAVLYVLQNSLPYTNNGYATRSNDIVLSLHSLYANVYPITRVGFPYDILDKKQIENINIDKVHNSNYYRLVKKGFHLHEVTTSKYIVNYALMLKEFAFTKQVFIIHAASNYVNGLAAINASKMLNLPSIYEVRGFWEITRASREKNFKTTDSFKMQKKLEIQACNDATSVIALSELVKDELIERGINRDKIYIVPNTVDTKKFSFQGKNTQLLSSLDWQDKFIVGFIGSVVDYEGLILLVKAAQILQKTNDKIRFLIVGSGNHLKYLKNEVQKRELSNIFHFTGRVPYEEVKEYYSIIDIASYPRRDWEVCSIVSPKKPFEAMAYGIPIIASSVKANSYFIENGINGLVHEKESVDSLVDAIHSLYHNDKLRTEIAKNAREWVIKNRDISKVSQLLQDIYTKTLNQYNKSQNV